MSAKGTAFTRYVMARLLERENTPAEVLATMPPDLVDLLRPPVIYVHPDGTACPKRATCKRKHQVAKLTIRL